METIIGVALWAGIGYLVVRAVRKALQKRGEAAATATAVAAADGGAGGAGSGSAVTNIHLHIGAPTAEGGHDGEAVPDPDDVAAALAVLARAAQAQQLDGANVHQLGAGPARMPARPNHPAQVRNGTRP